MRICLLGEYSGNLDEGMRKVSYHLAKELKKRHQVLTLDLRNAFTKDFWGSIKNFNPQIIHYVHGPSIKSFVLLKTISFYCRDAKTVTSATYPSFSSVSKRLVPLFKPNLILTQSYETDKAFKRMKCKTELLLNGVDVKRFTPATPGAKEKLRDKYGIDKEKFVILHVGSIKEGRNVQLLEKLQKKSNQVVIVGAVSVGIDQTMYEHLKKAGCLVWTKYFKQIEEIYTLSDCYVFPVVPKRGIVGRVPLSIETPLSVLEAMACNLPVVATKFGALPRVFDDGEGIFFADKEDDFINILENIKSTGINVKTREKVLPYSWENIGKKLDEIYTSS